ncbi:MAG: 1-acyl-sn-glycerol-3-phosphate acyltransferase [Spirulinaceae cyanobacterium]
MSVQPALKFIPPQFNRWVLRSLHAIVPLLMRVRCFDWLPARIARVETENPEILVDLYRQFQAGKIRLIFAFRHSEVDDPLAGLYLLSREIPRIARHKGVKLKTPLHAHFMYDRGMPLWAGAWLGWLFSRIGGVPIHRGRKLDLQGLRTTRSLLLDGAFPFALAPEGATNGHGEIISPLEPGVVQFAFWGAEDLKKANRPEDVVIVPIGIRYRYVTPPWSNIDKLLAQLELDCGLSLTAEAQLYDRVLALGEFLLDRLEAFYGQFYHCTFPDPVLRDDEAIPLRNRRLEARLHHLLDIALRVAEDYFHLSPQGTIIDRCRRLEEAGWQVIYRNDIDDIDALTPFDRGLADWVAEEAYLRIHHMRLVESFVAVTGTYVRDRPTAERYAEILLILFDLVSRVKNVHHSPRRPQLGWRWVKISVGDPLSVGDRISHYQQSRPAAKQAVRDLTQTLQHSLENLIL